MLQFKEYYRFVGETSTDEFWIDHEMQLWAKCKLRKRRKNKRDVLEPVEKIPSDAILTPYGVQFKKRGYI
jgi:hypothetical protein